MSSKTQGPIPLYKAAWDRKLRSGRTYGQFREELVPDVDILVLLAQVEEHHDAIRARVDLCTGDVDVQYVVDEVSTSQPSPLDVLENVPSGVLNVNDVAKMSPANVPPLETVVDQVRSNKRKREAIASGENTCRKRSKMLEPAAQEGCSLKHRLQSRQNRQRAIKRATLKATESKIERAQKSPQKISPPAQQALFQASQLRSKADGYTALNGTPSLSEYGAPDKEWTCEELMAFGFRLIENDGTCKIPILDGSRRVVGVVASQPKDPSYSSACQRFHLSIMKEGRQLPANSRRGGWPSLACGLSYGMGQLYPCRTKSSERDEAIMRRLLDSEEAKRISIFQSASLARWCPYNYTLYEQAKTFIQAHRKSKTERWNFKGSVFAAATINFGPRTWTHRHRDVQNLPHGWCAITALGDFDYKRSGHLILWDLKLIVEFPPGCTILIPSATIAHSNIPVAMGETRTSYTQYSAGPIFRWVDHGGRTLEELKQEDQDRYYDHLADLKRKAGLEGVKRFSTLEELFAMGLAEIED